MLRETYKGRKLMVKKGREWGTMVGFVNGQSAVSSYGSGPKGERKALDSMRATIDFIDRDPSVDGGRWGHYWYAPDTYEICPEGHAKDKGGACRHDYCMRESG
jgi:hypothetical protein